MNRNSYLKKSIRSWLDRGFREIYIVDWSSDVPVRHTLKDIKGYGIYIIRVEGQDIFPITIARNLASEYASAPYLFFIDCDVMLTYRKLLIKDLSPSYFYHGTLLLTGAATTGSVLLSRVAFDRMNGYAENNPTLPGEDLDLYRRLRRSGYRQRYFPFFSLRHISHPYELRYRYRPWNGLTRAKATNVTLKLPPWTIKHKRTEIDHELIMI